MKKTLWIAVFAVFLCSSVFAEESEGQKPAKHRTNLSREVSSAVSQPPGLKKQGRTPPGLKKKGKTPKGWSQGKKEGWDKDHSAARQNSRHGRR